VRRADAEKKLAVMRAQVTHLRPKFTVPFASFSFFSHEENSFTNDAANGPDAAVSALQRTDSHPVLLYPDDCWTVGDRHDNSSALARYRADYAGIKGRPLRKSARVSLDSLEAQARLYIERVDGANEPRMLALLRRLPILKFLGPIEIYLWDLDQNVRFSFEQGLESISERSARYDLRMSSDSLHFMLKNAWGMDTLTVNGRFQADAGGLKRLAATFGIDALNNTGLHLTPAFLLDSNTIGFLARIFARKLWSLRAQGYKAGPRAVEASSL
jgi:hypothetical protein